MEFKTSGQMALTEEGIEVRISMPSGSGLASTFGVHLSAPPLKYVSKEESKHGSAYHINHVDFSGNFNTEAQAHEAAAMMVELARKLLRFK